jgi:hypothetical protein
MARRISAYTVEVGEVKNLEIARGEDREIRLAFTSDGAPLDMTGALSCVLTVRNRTTGILVFARNYSGFVSLSSGGQPYFELAQADTVGQTDGPYDVDVVWTDASGYREQLLVTSTFRILPRVGTPSDPLTTPAAIPVVYGLRWRDGWSTPSGGYQINDAVTAQDGSLGATSISSFRSIATGNTYYPISPSLLPATGWAYVGQHGGGGPVSLGGLEGSLLLRADQGSSSVNTNQYWVYTPTEAVGAKWGQVHYQSTNATGSRKNQVHAMGWNVGPSGGALVPGEALLGMSWESYFNQAGNPGSEFHIIAQTNSGTLFRPFTMTFDRASGLAQLSLCYDQVFLQTADQVTTWWLFDNTVGTVQMNSAATPLTFNTNNVAVLAQARAAGGTVALLKLDSSNIVVIDPSAVGAKIGGNLTLVGNLTPTAGSTTIGTSAVPVSIFYGDFFRATVGQGGFDAKTTGALEVGSTVATSVFVGKQDNTGSLMRVNATNGTLYSPDQHHGFDTSNSGWSIFGNAGALMLGENGFQVFSTVEIATSFAKDGLIDIGVPGQRWRSLQIIGNSARPTADSTQQGRLFMTPGGGGVADSLDICLKAAGGSYSWKNITTG